MNIYPFWLKKAKGEKKKKQWTEKVIFLFNLAPNKGTWLTNS